MSSSRERVRVQGLEPTLVGDNSTESINTERSPLALRPWASEGLEFGRRKDSNREFQSPEFQKRAYTVRRVQSAQQDGKPIVGVHGWWAKQELRGRGLVQVR